MDDHGVSFDGVQSCYQVTFRQSDECLVPGAEALKNKSMWVSGSRFLIHKEVVIPHIFFNYSNTAFMCDFHGGFIRANTQLLKTGPIIM